MSASNQEYDPYQSGFDNPYEVEPTPGSKMRLTFSGTAETFWNCSTTNSSGNRELPLGVILPGTLKQAGHASDAQFICLITTKIAKICSYLGMDLDTKVRLSWECDDRSLKSIPKQPFEQKHFEELATCFYPELLEKHQQLQVQYPGLLKPGAAGWEKTWEPVFRDSIEAAQRELRKGGENRQSSLEFLRERNLIVIGTPDNNQVMANLCDILLSHNKSLAELGMYLFPRVGDLPLSLRRCEEESSWQEWRENNMDDVNIGWLHLMRNPWDPDRKRFLVYIGGFFAQGTPAAMRKWTSILDHVIKKMESQSEAIKEQATSGRFDPGSLTFSELVHSEMPTDVRMNPGEGDSLDRYSPCHVVKADVNYPAIWFFYGDSPRENWTDVRVSFPGNVKAADDVLPELHQPFGTTNA